MSLNSSSMVAFVKRHETLKSLAVRSRRTALRIRYSSGHNKLLESYLRSNQTRKLQLGAGDNPISGWLSTDINPRRDILYLDVTKPFGFDNDTFDYVFCEHLIEHLEYLDSLKFCKECLRVLKPSGILRVATPDFKFILELYNEKPTELQQDYMAYATKKWMPYLDVCQPIYVINNMFRNWGHKFIYDEKSLRLLLE